ncbi:hypothetical protein MME34_002786 [Escherichia coli]|nr:hypothetical protein [Escherichia coli]
MMVEEIRKGESLYFEDMTVLIKEVEERNKQARTLKRKRDSVTINGMVKKSTTSQTAITDVYAALLEETTKETHGQIDQHMEVKQQ